MKCKICGEKMTHTQFGLAGVTAKPNCRCGEIRSRARIKGCPQCGVKASHMHPVLNLFLVQRKMRRPYYEMRCVICGHRWRVKA